MSKLLDILLRPELPNVAKELPECKVKVKRLSRLAGEDVVFTLRALPYGRVQEIKELKEEIQSCKDSAEYYRARRMQLITGTEQLEQIAREEYHMQKPTEDVYIINETKK